MAHRFFSFLLKNQILLVLFIAVAGWFIFQIRGVLMSIFISYIIMAALNPFVQFFLKKKFPKILAVVIPYFTILFLFLIIIYPLIPFIVSQMQSFIEKLPIYTNQAASILGFSVDAKQIQRILASELSSNLGKNAVSVTGALFGGIFSTLTIIIVAFYLLLYHDELKHFIAHLFHKNIHQRVYETLTLIDDKLGAWLRGQLVLCVFIGLLTFIALTILGVPYALPLAVMAGFLEAIPTLGPTLSAVPATVVAISISPSLALVVIVVYMVIQLLENNILVPKIMQAAVGLNPVVVILGVTIGANLMGISGALLSIPFISFIIVILSSLKRNFDEK